MKNVILAGAAVVGLIAMGLSTRSWKQKTSAEEIERLENFRRRMPDMTAEELEIGIRAGLRTPCLFHDDLRREILKDAYHLLEEKKQA